MSDIRTRHAKAWRALPYRFRYLRIAARHVDPLGVRLPGTLTMTINKIASPFPSVDRVARSTQVQDLFEPYGRTAVIEAIRAVIESYRIRIAEPDYQAPGEEEIVERVSITSEATWHVCTASSVQSHRYCAAY